MIVMTKLIRLIVTCALLLISSRVEAQIINPTQVQFTASVDHNLVMGTTPVLQSYEIRYFDGSTLVQTINIGKPTPNTQNIITFNLSPSGVPKNRLLTLAIAAIGPGGTSLSGNSDPFAYPAPPVPVGKPTVQ